MDWSGERAVPVAAHEVSDRLAAPGGGWLRPFLRLAADRVPGAPGDRPPVEPHWYRIGPPTDSPGIRFVWRPPAHPERFRRFRGRFEVREGPPAVLALSGTTDEGGPGDAVVLDALLDLLASAFAGATPEAHAGEGAQLDG